MTKTEESAGTAGPFTIWLPFSLAPGCELSASVEMLPMEISGYPATLERDMHLHVLKIEGVPTEQDAENLLAKLGGGLLWAAVTRRVGLRFDLSLGPVTWCEDPEQAAANIFRSSSVERVDGLYDGSGTTIFPTSKKMVRMTGANATVTLGENPNSFLTAVNEGAALPSAETIISDAKLKLAVETYCSSHFEASVNARFLTLMTVLEVLNPLKDEPEKVRRKLDEWIEEAHKLAAEQSEGPDQQSFQSVASRLGYLKRMSIQRGLRTLVTDLLQRDGHPDAAEIGAKIPDLYGKRSDLVHEGDSNLGQSISDLEDIVRKTLQAAMRHGTA